MSGYLALVFVLFFVSIFYPSILCFQTWSHTQTPINTSPSGIWFQLPSQIQKIPLWPPKPLHSYESQWEPRTQSCLQREVWLINHSLGNVGVWGEEQKEKEKEQECPLLSLSLASNRKDEHSLVLNGFSWLWFFLGFCRWSRVEFMGKGPEARWGAGREGVWWRQLCGKY